MDTPSKGSFVLHRQPSRRANALESSKRPLTVMKFGGTSVADAASIGRAVDIVKRNRVATRRLGVVVSAMRGVTDNFIEAAHLSVRPDQRKTAGAILNSLRHRHETAMQELSLSQANRKTLQIKFDEIFEEAAALCGQIEMSGELEPAILDRLAGFGERLNAPLVAAALDQAGVVSEAVEATTLIVTDDSYGSAEPNMALTTARCRALDPLFEEGVVPVITGFIAATADGIPTTLGRNGSDFSATVLGAALFADEVIIWSDVDGVMSADPRLVPEAQPISELSYKEGAALAHFGAKVLHPKTLGVLEPLGVPVWIRNTFAPERSGTKITPKPAPRRQMLAVTVLKNVSLVKFRDSRENALATVSAAGVQSLIASTSTDGDPLLAVHDSEVARLENFMQSDGEQKTEAGRCRLDAVASDLALIAIVGDDAVPLADISRGLLRAFDSVRLTVHAIGRSTNVTELCFLVDQADSQRALRLAHGEAFVKLGNRHIRAERKRQNSRAKLPVSRVVRASRS
jgi:bifunctional aspartokinase / homoserine dehydrogenase 1